MMKDKLVDKVYEILSKVIDPELGRALVDYDLIMKEWINVDPNNKSIIVEWFPTSPFCPLLVYISAAIYYIIKKNFPDWNVKVKLHPNVIGANQWNELLENTNDLEKIINEMKDKGWLKKFLPEE